MKKTKDLLSAVIFRLIANGILTEQEIDEELAIIQENKTNKVNL